MSYLAVFSGPSFRTMNRSSSNLPPLRLRNCSSGSAIDLAPMYSTYRLSVPSSTMGINGAYPNLVSRTSRPPVTRTHVQVQPTCRRGNSDMLISSDCARTGVPALSFTCCGYACLKTACMRRLLSTVCSNSSVVSPRARVQAYRTAASVTLSLIATEATASRKGVPEAICPITQIALRRGLGSSSSGWYIPSQSIPVHPPRWRHSRRDPNAI